MSSFKGRENCNEFSIGIELEGTDENAYNYNPYANIDDGSCINPNIFDWDKIERECFSTFGQSVWDIRYKKH